MVAISIQLKFSYCILSTQTTTPSFTRSMCDAGLKFSLAWTHIAFMGKKTLKVEMKAATGDPVQAALLKAAARSMRCAKPEDPQQQAEGLRAVLTISFSSGATMHVKPL